MRCRTLRLLVSGNYYLVVGGGRDGGRDGGVERCEKWICQIIVLSEK